MSNSFDTLNKVVKEEDVVVQAKGSQECLVVKESNVASSSNPGSSIGGFKFGEFGDSDEDDVFEPNDVMSSYMVLLKVGPLKVPTLNTHIPASRLVPAAGKENAAELTLSE
ncbi:hypothetical protein Tco_1480906 [Tanacetum coccineum]